MGSEAIVLIENADGKRALTDGAVATLRVAVARWRTSIAAERDHAAGREFIETYEAYDAHLRDIEVLLARGR